LLGKDKGLDKLLQLGRFIGGFTDDLNNDVVVGCLGINVRNADLAVLEVEFFDTLLDSLCLLDSNLGVKSLQTYTSTDGNWSYLSLKTRNELGALPIEELYLLSALHVSINDMNLTWSFSGDLLKVV
jgi:hypothetical protein